MMLDDSPPDEFPHEDAHYGSTGRNTDGSTSRCAYCGHRFRLMEPYAAFIQQGQLLSRCIGDCR